MPESSLERGVAVMRQFGRGRQCLTAADLGAALAIPRSSLHRLLCEMVDLGLLRRDADGRYALDAGVLLLGHEFLASQDLVALARPVLEALSASTGWTTNLAVRQGTSIVYLMRCRGEGAVTENVSVGASLPAHATLMGRVLLAGLDADELGSLYESHVFGDRGDGVPASLQALIAQLADDRAASCLVSAGYYEAGLAVVAAPVRERGDRLAAAINANRVGATAMEAERMRAAVIEAANTISAQLGASPGSRIPTNGERACLNTAAA
ncbi:IclR family transcriptional regulator [Novosphingobium sp. 9U]|uniref:IclR family transcriptional regulator n=1 Tax=Novosphingobium sp. 9U TaxID=2653158 RepID=UPI0012F2818D|nr:IclR family transcriptional regulator [Novosphingobium sp. 9U]VWX54559.1 putative Pca regulon regulatory protein [Novosphingobium sp. 9U]